MILSIEVFYSLFFLYLHLNYLYTTSYLFSIFNPIKDATIRSPDKHWYQFLSAKGIRYDDKWLPNRQSHEQRASGERIPSDFVIVSQTSQFRLRTFCSKQQNIQKHFCRTNLLHGIPIFCR